MLSMEGWTTIRYLAAQGKSIKGIAAELGVARNTVRLALRREGPPRYRRPPRPNPQRVPFVGTHEELRKVSWDCLVSFGGTRYSVPWRYAAQQVWLRPSRGTQLVVRDRHGEESARHALAGRKNSTVLDPAHYTG